MSIDLWAAEGAFLLGPPLRAVGYLQLAATVGLLLTLTVPALLRQREDQGRFARQTGLFLALIFIAPLAESLLVVNTAGGSAPPGVPIDPVAPGFSLLGPLTWFAAAGLLGAPQAALVGFAAGLARGGWQTNSLITPFTVAAMAAVAAYLMRLPYRELLARACRHPLGAGSLAGLGYGLLRAGELFAHSGGEPYDGLDFALGLAPALIAAGLAEGALAGGMGSAIRSVRPDLWARPGRTRTAPYNRTLAGRMLSSIALLGVLAVGGLAIGQWALARGAVRELVADGMRRTAQQAGDGIPFFVQSGRRAIRDQAQALSGGWDPGAFPDQQLETQFRGQPIFSGLIVFDSQGTPVAVAPARGRPYQPPRPVEIALPVTLQGVPQEVVVEPIEGARAVDLIFLAPIVGADSGQVIGAVAGLTSLDGHPVLSPVLAQLADPGVGEGMLVDNQGAILFHPDPGRLLESSAVEMGESEGEVALRAAPDGTRRLEYVYPVPGYSWRVAVTVPQRVVDRMAFPIAARLLAVLAAVGVAFLGFVYLSSQRLTRPLRQMASVAEAIARGDLERPVEAYGEDEVGRLAASFERMRRGLKARLAQMDLLLTVGQSLAAELDIGRSLPKVLDGLRELTGADVARLTLRPGALADRERETQQSGAGDDWSELDQQVRELSRERGAFALDNPARARAVLDLEAVAGPVGALMAAPLRTEEGYLGTLWLARRDRDPFEVGAQNLLAIVAAQVGVWLSNVLLFRRAEEERQRLGAVLQATPDAVIAVDRTGVVTLANPAAESVLNCAPEQALGRPAQEVVEPESVQGLLLDPEGVEEGLEVRLERGVVLAAAGDEIVGAAGVRSGRVAVLWDVTHYKRLDMLKSEFVNTVSHDLRAPLTLMRGYATMISMVGALNEQQKDFVGKILDSIDGMAELVENLLDLGRIEAGFGLDLQQVDVPEVVQDVVETYRPKAVNKQVALEVELGDDLTPVWADSTLLRQAIANLLDNAVKYTPGGGTVRLRSRQEQGQLLLQVQDTGVGIAPADKNRLFERFYRARRPESLKSRGSGLGLSIVKSIAEQHGGEVRVESRLGSGSTFTLVIPVKPEPAPEDGMQPG